MAAPASSPEIEVGIRRFQGVNTQIDSVFLGGQFLKSSQNLFPEVTYRLKKRPGTVAFLTVSALTAITDILYINVAGAQYMYIYGNKASGDQVMLSINGTAPSLIWIMPSTGRTGRLIHYGDFVYVGNGFDPIVQIQISGPVVQLDPVAHLIPTGGSVQPAAATAIAPQILPGSYSYCWAVYNTASKLYVSRSDPGSVLVSAGENLAVTAPSVALGGGVVYRLFVAGVNEPVEFGTFQGGDLNHGDTFTLNSISVTADTCPATTNVSRTGNTFALFLNRLVMAGMQTDDKAALATGTILPGYEQVTYNTGAFFPAFARLPMPEPVTAVGLAGITSGFDPTSPLIVQTATRTTLYTGGDPFDPNGTATRVEISDRIGCPSPDTALSTPVGYVFMGMDSVYLIAPGGGYPQDVGYPIGNLIREMPYARRALATAVFHKGFYKLAFSTQGQGQNLTQFWLDLRQGIGQTPSWWGPMLGYAASAFTVALDDPIEFDRGYVAIEGTNIIAYMHQDGIFSDLGTDIIATFHTGTFDNDKPFQNKLFTRFRIIVHGEDMTTISVLVITDSGKLWNLDPIEVFGIPTAQWNHLVPEGKAQWNDAQWANFTMGEAQTIAPLTRPRGLCCEVVATHSAGSDIEYRDFQLLYLPVERKVRYVGESTG